MYGLFDFSVRTFRIARAACKELRQQGGQDTARQHTEKELSPREVHLLTATGGSTESIMCTMP